MMTLEGGSGVHSMGGALNHKAGQAAVSGAGAVGARGDGAPDGLVDEEWEGRQREVPVITTVGVVIPADQWLRGRPRSRTSRRSSRSGPGS
jgi:hypothetical protein